MKKLQEDLALETTGILLGDTTYGLMEKLREKIQEDDPQLLKAKEVLLEKVREIIEKAFGSNNGRTLFL